MDTVLKPFIALWQETLEHIGKLDKIPRTSFESWFLPLKVVDVEENILFLGAANDFVKEWVETNYREIISSHLATISQNQINQAQIVLLGPGGVYQRKKPKKSPDSLQTNAAIGRPGMGEPKNGPEKPGHHEYHFFNPKYTFDTFVIGSSNRFAHAAALAVAEQPGKSYNPLFIMGGVGLGKTHLMHAVGQFILENKPDARVSYFSAEKFTNEWIDAIKDNRTEGFRSKYRNNDVILIDDIQFISDKIRTQEEFFHTFNTLYEQGSQIIISSDRPPQQIPTLEERLITRLLWGLTTDISAPDLETRIAILKKKADMEKIYIPNDDALFYIANQIESNIRELEGALNRVAAYAKLNKAQISRELAIQALKNILPENKVKVITVELVRQTTAQYFHLKSEDMVAKKRTSNISFPRQIAMYLCRELTDTTFEKIGEEFGGRHYSTVIHACEEIGQKIKSDPKTKKSVDDIVKQIKKM